MTDFLADFLIETEPRKAVVPLLGLNERYGHKAFLGTGSFIADGAILLTADHVIRDWAGPIGTIIVPSSPETEWQRLRLVVLERDPQHDLALLKTVETYHPPAEFTIPPNCTPDIVTNIHVMTVEYGTTKIDANGIDLNPARRIGNITRDFKSLDILGAAGDGALELSFPALRGASGAPVFYTMEPWHLVGVIVANHSYHLLPAQIESVLNADNTIMEETRYLLPQAIAVNICHLKAMYDRHLV